MARSEHRNHIEFEILEGTAMATSEHRTARKPRTPEFNKKMARKVLWVDDCSTLAWVKARLKLITPCRLQSRAYRVVGSVIQQMSGVANVYNPSLRRLLDAFPDQWRLQKIAAQLYVREAEALAGFEGVRCHDLNVAQLEEPSGQTHPGSVKWREAGKIIKQNRNPSHEVVGEIELRQKNTDSMKVERVGAIKAKLSRRIVANRVRELPEPQCLSREEDDQASAFSEEGVTQNLGRQHLITQELLRKAHSMMAGLDLIGRGRLQSRANFGSRDWSRNRAQGNGSTDIHSMGTASQAIAVLQNRLQRSITTDFYTYVKVLQMCSKQKDLVAAKQVHGHIIQSGMDKNVYVAVTLLNVYIKCGALLDARRVFDQLEMKSVVTWTNMIAGYAKSGHVDSALELFNQMRQEGVLPDEITYMSILKACANPLALKLGKAVHVDIRDAGFESDVRIGTALLKMYSKSGSIDDARLVFARMEKRDVATWTIMIGGLAQHGFGHEAYQLFLEMKREGFEPDAFTYVSILNASASDGALEWVKLVHGHASKAGLESDLRVCTSLVHMYAKSGSIDDARLLFDRMKKRDVYTWTVMIGGLAQHGCGHEAYRLFLQMRREGFEPDAITYVSILNASASEGALEWVKMVHGHASKAGLESDLRVGNALVHMYAESGSIDDARLVFDRMKKRDVYTWTVMIGGLAQHGCGHEAYRLFLQMRREGLEPDAITYVSILNASASEGALEWVKMVHGHASKAGLESDLRVGNALVHMYAKSGSIDDARLLFDRMKKRDVYTWTVMIGGLAQHGCGHEAYQLFLQMREEGLEPNAFTYVSLLNASASAMALEWVKEVHSQARKAGLESDLRVGNALVHMYAESGSIDDARLVFDRMKKRDVITWTVMIGGLAQQGYGHEAYRLFCRMRQEGCEPNAFTYVSILNPSASAGAWEWLKEVHVHASKAGLGSDLRVGTALVRMYAESGSIDDARVVFDRMRKRDVVTWTVMIGGLAQHGCGDEALELFREMTADGVEPDGTSFVAVLWACCHGDLVNDGRRLFSAMMQDYGIQPTIVHYNFMVDLLGRAGHLKEAKFFITDMPIEPNGITWRALLGACRTYGSVELGELAAKELFKLEPSEASTYVLLSNIYAAAGEWENVSFIRSMMPKRGVRKEPGRSWIEVDKKIHHLL